MGYLDDARQPIPSANPNLVEVHRVGLAGAENVQGEEQKKLDILSDEIMVNALRASGKCSVLVTEERVS